MTDNNIKNKLAGLVVLYNPDNSIEQNISSYIDQVGRLYVFDNSDIRSEIADKLQLNNKVTIIHSGHNEGIAKALNAGALKAIDDGYNFLLTMDQDSFVTAGMIDNLLTAINEFNNAGIISPVHTNKFNTPPTSPERYQEILVTKTSGNILNLEVYKSVGPFNEDFFIDYVDIEYCMRIIQAGYKVVQVNDAILIHNEANLTEKKFLFKIVYPYNHHPVRFYYKTRNRCYLKDKFKHIFPEYFGVESDLFVNNLIKVFLYEKQKLLKLKMSWLGYKDYKKGKTGKLTLQ